MNSYNAAMNIFLFIFVRWVIWYLSILACFYVVDDLKKFLHSYFIVVLCYESILFYHISSNYLLLFIFYIQFLCQWDDSISQNLLRNCFGLVSHKGCFHITVTLVRPPHSTKPIQHKMSAQMTANINLATQFYHWMK